MEDCHPRIIGAKPPAQRMLHRAPSKARKLVAGMALVSLIDGAVGMDDPADRKTIDHEIWIVRTGRCGYCDRRRCLLSSIARTLREHPLHTGIIGADAVSGQLI